jgi:mannose/fructose/N-acetylgalactosamine-specific phosphotransferase system component IIC
MEFATVGWLLLWGTVVGLDLATVAQVMVARPMVAAAVAGWIVGDVQTGLIIGAVLELFALEVLPFGAARYPDYGVGAVAAVATAAGAPGLFGVGMGVAVGLVVAYLGEIAIQLVRQQTAMDVQRRREAIDSGDVTAIYRTHLRGIRRDAQRALGLAGLGLLIATVVRVTAPVTLGGAVLLSAVAMGVGLGTTFVSGLRIARHAHGGWVWLVTGLLAGVAWVVVR